MIGAARVVAAVCSMLAVAASAGAQAIRPIVSASRSTVSYEITGRDASRPLRVSELALSQGRRAATTSFSIISGAVLGAGLGYFLSQVVKSDWEGMRTGERAAHRRRFALSGAAVGALGGFLVRPRLRRGQVEPPRIYVYVPRSDRHYIARDELRRAIVLNALEAVQLLRPEWLAGSQSAAKALINGSSANGDSSIAVYVIDTRIGGAAALADISIPELEELRLYEPREAERRWGTAHPYGAIEVVPVAPRGTR